MHVARILECMWSLIDFWLSMSFIEQYRPDGITAVTHLHCTSVLGHN